MQRRRGVTAGIVGVIAVALAFSVVGGAFAAKTVKLQANLKGKNEVGGADRKANGKADLKLKKKKRKICFEISFRNMQNPIAGHIHKGVEGVDGPIKVTLFEDPEGLPSPIIDCVKPVKKKLIKKVDRKPEKWYVNLHTPEFPAGAARGQLKEK